MNNKSDQNLEDYNLNKFFEIIVKDKKNNSSKFYDEMNI
jgi:hypothetical protein